MKYSVVSRPKLKNNSRSYITRSLYRHPWVSPLNIPIASSTTVRACKRCRIVAFFAKIFVPACAFSVTDDALR